MTATIFALVGVVIGAVLKALGDAVLETRRDASTTRAAARLIFEELLPSLATTIALRDKSNWLYVGLPGFGASEHYEGQREVIARHADNETWLSISTAYLCLKQVQDRASAAASRSEVNIGTADQAVVLQAHAAVVVAITNLGKHTHRPPLWRLWKRRKFTEESRRHIERIQREASGSIPRAPLNTA